MNIPEKFLHYLWKHRLFSEAELFTQSGDQVEVIQVGQHNPDAGPDFQNARIRIGTTIWVGNVEIHIHASDWYHHGHGHDKAYDNVVLQVVLNNNQPVRRTNNELIPTAELLFDNELFMHYRQLLENESWIPCEKKLPEVDRSIIDFWLSRLTIERLEHKSHEIEQSLRESQNNWESAFYRKLARNFGFKVNAEPFELLARSLPLKHLTRHKDNLFQLEALFFGQAGFLQQKRLDDPYHMKLFDEYLYLRKKFQLKPIEKHLWRFARLRPVNFPTVRIAQFCALMHRSDRLFSNILEKRQIRELKHLLDVEPSSYWHTHYGFHKTSTRKIKRLGSEAFQNLIINTLVPFLFVYGIKQNIPSYKERALDLLLELDPEKNSIIRRWSALGIDAPNAYHSQALLELKNNYCNHRRCLDCQIGNHILMRHDRKEQSP
ncbi:MAG: DUF2851 family protein [Bacteroidales bacterium]|nr:DUF2851 family protein [Bacteroidales bacterium]